MSRSISNPIALSSVREAAAERAIIAAPPSQEEFDAAMSAAADAVLTLISASPHTTTSDEIRELIETTMRKRFDAAQEKEEEEARQLPGRSPSTSTGRATITTCRSSTPDCRFDTSDRGCSPQLTLTKVVSSQGFWRLRKVLLAKRGDDGTLAVLEAANEGYEPRSRRLAIPLSRSQESQTAARA